VETRCIRNLDWFFDQWIHTTHTLDYRLGELGAEQDAAGRWTARVEVIREGEIWMPVDLRVNDATIRLTSRDRRQVVVVNTDTRPTVAVLDPENILIDMDPSNNRGEFSLAAPAQDHPLDASSMAAPAATETAAGREP
jgi:hypothetical protein